MFLYVVVVFFMFVFLGMAVSWQLTWDISKLSVTWPLGTQVFEYVSTNYINTQNKI